MKTGGAAREETRPSVLLSMEPTSHKGLSGLEGLKAVGREGVPDSAISGVEQFQGDMALGSHWWGWLKSRAEKRVTGDDEVIV